MRKHWYLEVGGGGKPPPWELRTMQDLGDIPALLAVFSCFSYNQYIHTPRLYSTEHTRRVQFSKLCVKLPVVDRYFQQKWRKCFVFYNWNSMFAISSICNLTRPNNLVFAKIHYIAGIRKFRNVPNLETFVDKAKGSKALLLSLFRFSYSLKLEKLVHKGREMSTYILGHQFNKRLESFAPCYSQSVFQADFKKTILFSGFKIP
jgi:hypothetical protein